jgi:hypothetical protein
MPTGKALSGTGTLTAPVAVNGSLASRGAPGSGPGVLTAGSAVTFVAGSAFAVGLNGNTPGSGTAIYG